MQKRIIWVALILLITAGAISYLLLDSPALVNKRDERDKRILSVSQPGELLENGIIMACGTPECTTTVVAESAQKQEETKEKDEIYSMFHVDEHGNLLLNENTRLNVEKLYALNTPEELDEKFQKLSEVLPDTAHRQVVHLVDYFDKYMRDSKQIYPPDEEVETVEEAIAQIKGLHDLRVMHFGADVAKAFFAEEEKLTQQLLHLMSLEKDKNLSMAEKAHRAQQLLQSNEELAAIYNPNRK
ncbi:MAG TPA: lipase secretion chaperone [Smithellaceae bacterium]|nr:hypothetical protein [Syntrophaceae bacterium]HQG22652.1 lipase secretion chaperone [Smithellaceae bacterium]HQK26674.1 lipase secretion chaperone [Smithellaceae bacterium]